MADVEIGLHSLLIWLSNIIFDYVGLLGSSLAHNESVVHPQTDRLDSPRWTSDILLCRFHAQHDAYRKETLCRSFSYKFALLFAQYVRDLEMGMANLLFLGLQILVGMGSIIYDLYYILWNPSGFRWI